MGLTAVAIKAAKGRAKPYKLTDSDGLHLLVLPSGGRYWRMNYRFLGKQKTSALGVWPEVELADARAKRDEAQRLLAKGIDPAEHANDWSGIMPPSICFFTTLAISNILPVPMPNE
jgi:Arm DNA-binding domain